MEFPKNKSLLTSDFVLARGKAMCHLHDEKLKKTEIDLGLKANPDKSYW